ncbi:hypothetical protein ACFRAU_15030 [Arthrobacter sp. NPDC056691]|uniref:hypothetical protein n=1 Tax=Arthrobacter sp. NPDC056691 TaxID=3345913 RepID=UPI00366E1181
MNWLRPDYPYAKVSLPEPFENPGGAPELDAQVSTTFVGDELRTEITLTNLSDRPFFTRVDDIGISLPLEDRYDDPQAIGTRRCNAHVFCGGSSSFVLALRMGGEAPHLGLILTEGSPSAYSIERDATAESNDRGCFIMHPSPLVLEPGEQTRVSWSIFPCLDKEDFFVQAGRRSRFVRAEWDRYVLFVGETARLRIEASFSPSLVTVNGVPAQREPDGSFTVEFDVNEPGEREMVVRAGDRTVHTRILVKDRFDDVLERRCAFIARHQQYDGSIDNLRGAFLTYDNEEDHLYYNHVNDYDGGRERVGMGILLAQYLCAVRDGIIEVTDRLVPLLVRESLDKYAAYVRRELIDEESGTSFNDMGRDGSYKRLYNAPWYASFFLELHRLDGNPEDVVVAYRIIAKFYEEGGGRFYPIEHPISALMNALEALDLPSELAAARENFVRHADAIATVGTLYPPSEVNYEQSIVAPAADILLQVYLLTGEEKFLEAARGQIIILDQFNGVQPDYHLREVAVRHWDGHWFGKRRTYGDTFPHY